MTHFASGSSVRRVASLVVIGVLLASAVSRGAAAEGSMCLDAIRRVEASTAIPPGLLAAVALGESGRYDKATKQLAPWPWTVNNAGDGRYFASKTEAMVHVEMLKRRGERNIDVGCMQVNLMHHPDAFANLAAAFDPSTNVRYGGQFLIDLWQETGTWARAVERYHTADPVRGQAYREKIYARWQDIELGRVPSVGSPSRTELAALSAEPPAGASEPLRSVQGFISLSPAPGRITVLGPREATGIEPAKRPRAGPMIRLPGAIRPVSLVSG